MLATRQNDAASGPCSDGKPVVQDPSHMLAQHEKAIPTGPARTQRASTISVAARPAAIPITWNDNTQGQVRGSRKGPVPPSLEREDRPILSPACAHRVSASAVLPRSRESDST